MDFQNPLMTICIMYFSFKCVVPCGNFVKSNFLCWLNDFLYMLIVFVKFPNYIKVVEK